jgi:hypothetical protein
MDVLDAIAKLRSRQKKLQAVHQRTGEEICEIAMAIRCLERLSRDSSKGKGVSVRARKAWERGKSDLKPFVETLWVTNPTR